MGIKRIAREINKAKDLFIQWLNENNADGIDVFEGENDDSWDYYRHVSGFIGDNFYTVYFTMWNGKEKITYVDEENRYEDMAVDEFLELIK